MLLFSAIANMCIYLWYISAWPAGGSTRHAQWDASSTPALWEVLYLLLVQYFLMLAIVAFLVLASGAYAFLSLFFHLFICFKTKIAFADIYLISNKACLFQCSTE